MKKTIALLMMSLFILIGTISSSNAWDETYDNNYDYYVPDYVPTLKSSIDWNSVEFEWSKAEDDDFRYYKLVHSESSKQPTYPDDKTMFVWKVEQNENKVKYKKWYWRVCHVFRWYYEQDWDSKYRACSNVIYLAEKEESETSEKKYEAKKQYVEKEYSEKKVVKKTTLSDKTQKRANTIITNFKKKLDASNLSSENKVKRINIIISKLNTIAKSKPQLKVLITYLVVKLEDVRADYQDDFEDIEWLFDF